MQQDLDALLRLYKEVDTLLEGSTCPASTDCCHFGRTGREPQLWPNEVELLERALRARPLPRRRAGALPIADDEGRCPLLDAHGRCSVYAARPFGCRTYFCDRAEHATRDGRAPRAALAELGRRVADLAQRAEPSCRGPRALTRVIGTTR